MHHPVAGASRRCPVQPSTPLGPDQANVLYYYYYYNEIGNVAPHAANAILGSHTIEQYCVRAVGSSHEVNRGLNWTPPRCGRFRVNRIRVRALCRSSSNQGRNLFPPRRFSYHTRFSRFNGTV
jgi:hypothetical protein